MILKSARTEREHRVPDRSKDFNQAEMKDACLMSYMDRMGQWWS